MFLSQTCALSQSGTLREITICWLRPAPWVADGRHSAALPRPAAHGRPGGRRGAGQGDRDLPRPALLAAGPRTQTVGRRLLGSHMGAWMVARAGGSCCPPCLQYAN